MTRMLKKKKKTHTHTHNTIFGGLAHHCFNTPGIQRTTTKHNNKQTQTRKHAAANSVQICVVAVLRNSNPILLLL